MATDRLWPDAPWIISEMRFAQPSPKDNYMLVQYEISCYGAEESPFTDRQFSLSGGCNLATARLIAAAPIQHEALVKMNNHLHDVHDGEPISNELREAWDVVEAAIKAATP